MNSRNCRVSSNPIYFQIPTKAFGKSISWRLWNFYLKWEPFFFSSICWHLASFSPVPKISWEYQGFPVVPRFNGSRELNFQFFQILGGGYQLKIQRITEYSGGTFKCYAENSLGQVFDEGQLSVTREYSKLSDPALAVNLKYLCWNFGLGQALWTFW